jgi:hypothetical protein
MSGNRTRKKRMRDNHKTRFTVISVQRTPHYKGSKRESVQALQIPIAILTDTPASPGCRAPLGYRQPACCSSGSCDKQTIKEQ